MEKCYLNNDTNELRFRKCTYVLNAEDIDEKGYHLFFHKLNRDRDIDFEISISITYPFYEEYKNIEDIDKFKNEVIDVADYFDFNGNEEEPKVIYTNNSNSTAIKFLELVII